MTTYVIPSDALYPRDEAHRLRIYARRGDRLQVVAATDVDGLGRALQQLDEDAREYGERILDLGALGVLDTVAGRWLISPWHRPDGTPQLARVTTSTGVFERSPSGASLTCRFCGTIYDNHPLVGDVPPVGDGCANCSSYEDDEATGLAGRPDGNGEKW